MSIRYWLVVQPLDRACEHVEGGFVQVPWGLREGVEPMREADGVVLYSPRARNPDGEPLRAFVHAGRVMPGDAYRAGGRGTSPWRRDVEWMRDARPAPIRPLRDMLEFTQPRYWGEQLRDGWLEISRRDFIIAEDAVRRPSPEPSGLVLGMLRDTGLGMGAGASTGGGNGGAALVDGRGGRGADGAIRLRRDVPDWPTLPPGGRA